MPYIDIHSERVWIPCHPLRSMEKASGSGERWGFYEPTRDDGARP